MPPRWTRVRITEMIRSIVYTGALASHKRESRQLRDGGRRVPSEEWIVHPEHHEAIIPRETWERAGAMLQTRSHSSRRTAAGEDRVFRCAYCGRKLQKYGGKNPVFRCVTAAAQNSPCASVKLNRTEAEASILAALREKVRGDGTGSEETAADERAFRQRAEPAVRQTEKSAIRHAEREADRLRRRKLENYEAFRSGAISAERYREESESLTEQIAESEEKRRIWEENQQNRILTPPGEERNPVLLLEQAEAGSTAALYRAVRQVTVSSGGRMEIEWAFPELPEAEK